MISRDLSELCNKSSIIYYTVCHKCTEVIFVHGWINNESAAAHMYLRNEHSEYETDTHMPWSLSNELINNNRTPAPHSYTHSAALIYRKKIKDAAHNTIYTTCIIIAQLAVFSSIASSALVSNYDTDSHMTAII